jgi:hypothetical protein
VKTILACLVVFLGVCTSSGHSQEAGVGPWAFRGSGSDLVPSVGWRAWIGRSDSGARIQVSRTQGARVSTRVMCAGLVFPGDYCPDEPARTEADLRHYAVSFAHAIGGTPVRVRPTVGITHARVRIEGAETQRRLEGEGASLLAGVGVELSRAVVTRHLIARIGGEVGFGGPVSQCSDCPQYSYEDGYRFGSVWAGLGVRVK